MKRACCHKKIKKTPLLISLVVVLSFLITAVKSLPTFADPHGFNLGVLSSTVTPEMQANSSTYYEILTGCFWHATDGIIKTNTNNPDPSTWFDKNTSGWWGKADETWAFADGKLINCGDVAKQALPIWGWGTDYKTFLENAGCSYNGTDQFKCSSDDSTRASNFQKAVQKQAYQNGPVTTSSAAEYIRSLNTAQNICKIQDLGTMDTIKAASDQTTNTRINKNYYSIDDKSYATVYVNVNLADSNKPVLHGLTYVDKIAYNFAPDSSSGEQFAKNIATPGGIFSLNTYGHINQHSPRIGDADHTIDNTSLMRTCTELANGVSKNAAAYAQFYQNNPSAGTPSTGVGSGGGSSPATAGKDCGSEVQGTGWILCPMINSGSGLADFMWTLIQKLLNVNPLEQPSPVYDAWQKIRDIANVVFVIFFLIIIFSQVTGFGIDNYGIKRLLPRLIICALLVNLSFVIIQLAVDISNIIGSGLYNIIASLAPTPNIHWASLPSLILSGAIGLGLTASVVSPAGLFWLMAPGLLMALLSFIAALATLIFRQAIIPVLAIIAPLAFVAYLLPNTEKWFTKWRELLTTMLMLYPLAAVVFAGAQFAASVMAGKGDKFIPGLIAEIILAVPLFSLPFIARQGGAILSAVNGQLNKWAEHARKPFTEYSQSKRGEATARWQADRRPEVDKDGNIRRNARGQRIDENGNVVRGGARRWAEDHGLGGIYNAPRTLGRTAALRTQQREYQTAAYKDEFKDQVISGSVKGFRGRPLTGAGQAYRESMAAKENLQSADQEAAAQLHAENPYVNGQRLKDRADTAEHNLTLAKQATENRRSNSPEGRDLRKRVAEGEKVAQHDKNAIAHEVDDSARGRRLNERLAADEKIAQTDRDNTTTRFEESTDPTYFNVKAEAAAAKKQSEAATAETQQLMTEASTHHVAAPGSKLEQMDIVSPGARATLQSSQRRADIANSATQEATRKVNQEYEKDVAPIEDVYYEDAAGNPLLDRLGNPIPTGEKRVGVTATTLAAAGIGSVDRVQAVQVQAGDKREGEESTAAQILAEATTDVAGKISKATGDLADAVSPAQRDTEDGAICADSRTNILLTTGQKGLDKLMQTTGDLPGGDTSKAAEAIRSRALKSGVKGRSSALDQYGIDPDHRSMGEILRDPVTYTRLNIGQLASQGDFDLEAAYACGGINPTFAQNIIDHLQDYPDINGRKLEIFKSVADWGGAGPNPADTDPESLRFRTKLPPPRPAP